MDKASPLGEAPVKRVMRGSRRSGVIHFVTLSDAYGCALVASYPSSVSSADTFPLGGSLIYFPFQIFSFPAPLTAAGKVRYNKIIL